MVWIDIIWIVWALGTVHGGGLGGSCASIVWEEEERWRLAIDVSTEYVFSVGAALATKQRSVMLPLI